MLRLASKRLLGLTSREIPSQPVHRHRFGRSSCLWRFGRRKAVAGIWW
ncbi:hypothetical protein Gotur_015060 [Gossypium turneri]